ncbi:hypothetical protein GLAREA_11650 [Glarea lozoyensis ATCC 20868]|uniref:Uncharacterized protein n=1 Tax=Glarea lozoyensis (strain ATCC 20868 / MF5171) TaxID=1116229 RepID=S3CIH6_GLAL2|nr:uncharacterized protein GLAREA_11650 [Glarea lozoyensis ATCC 20868]EPE25069.1 hypothetical protein GLAREA_11650 [Glarea lozoyensis ATCC 20868]
MHEEFALVGDRCAFCRERFPVDSRSPEDYMLDFDGWATNVRVVIRTSNDNNHNEKFAISDIFHISALYAYVCPDTKLARLRFWRRRRRGIKLIRKPGSGMNGDTGPLAFGFHNWCCEVLAWKMKGVSANFIYKLARALTPDTSLWQETPETSHCLDWNKKVDIVASHEVQPLGLSNLPIELRVKVWRHVGLMSPYSAFITVISETCRLAHRLRGPSNTLVHWKQGSRLSAQVISVFGTEYIQSLTVDQGCGYTPYEPSGTTYLRYIQSCGGICAIQLVCNSRNSGWIGKIPTGNCIWYGHVVGEGSTLKFESNDLHSINISLADANDSDTVLWDQQDPSLSLVDKRPLSFIFDQETGHPLRIDQGKFFRYLSFYNKNQYARAITVYISAYKKIVGAEAHFATTSRVSGKRSGCALHFPFYPGEKIAFIWIRLLSSSIHIYHREYFDMLSAIMIQTTMGRLHTFGPHISPDGTFKYLPGLSKWNLLHHTGSITGVYYRNVSAGDKILCLGVTSSDEYPSATPLGLQKDHFPISSWRHLVPGRLENKDMFISIATLRGVQEVKTCHIENRSIGLWLQYDDDRANVFGQGRTTPDTRHTCVYDNTYPPITQVHFEVFKSKSSKYQVVTNVFFSLDAVEEIPDSEMTYKAFGIDDEILWFFDNDFDQVTCLTGDMKYIPIAR